MGNFISKLFDKKKVIDIEKTQLEAKLSINNALVDVELLTLAVNQNQIISLQDYLSNSTSVELNEYLDLSKEIKNLESYISAYQTIKGINLHLKFQNQIDKDFSFPIAPFILFPLIQNAFQFGYNSMEKYPIRVKLNTIGNKLKLEVSNRVNHHIQNQESTSLVKIYKSRLSLLYPNTHTLLINSNSILFKATLIIE